MTIKYFHQKVVVLFLLVCVTFIITCCDFKKSEEEKDFPLQPVVHENRNKPEEVLKIGITPLQVGAILQAADSLGYFLDVVGGIKFETFETAQQIATAVSVGKIDLGHTGLGAAVYNFAAKNKLRIISGGHKEKSGWLGGAYLISHQAWEKGIRLPEDLKYAKIGITDEGSSIHYAFGLLADKYDFQLNRDNIISLYSVSNLISAVQSNQIDVTIINSAIAHSLSKKYNVHVIGYVSEVVPWQVVATFANMEAMELGSNKRKQVAAFLRGYKKMASVYTRLFQLNNAKLTSEDIKAKELMVEHIVRFAQATVTQDQVRDYPPYMDPEGRVDLKDIKHQIEWYKKHNKVYDNANTDNAIDLSLLMDQEDKNK